ncbi:unnamed protein product, partial [Mesorhabditis belari]|uniref:Uncharacterized protein n=1 Tax=Mesorhabditis belari TaxID=2138241 RepID=A0AAF3JB56_9BILA
MLQDVNDHPPKFSQSSSTCGWRRNAPGRHLVGTIVATADPDRAVQLSSAIAVRVHVSDANDHPPTLRSSVLLINRFLDGPIIEKIGSVPAPDPDQNATLEYSIESNDLMIVDRYSGKISLKGSWKRNIDTILKACVSDGVNTVCNPRFQEIQTINRFSLDVGGELGDCHVNKKGSNVSTEISFVILDRGRIVSSTTVSELISGFFHKLSSLSLLDIRIFDSDSCSNEPCSYYQRCRDTLKFVGNEFHQTDNFLAHSLKTLKTHVCECPPGFASSSDKADKCDIRVDECFSGPCQHNGSCFPLENGYRCECENGWIGKHCEISTNVANCLPGYCKDGATCEVTNEHKMKCTKCRHSAIDSDERCRLRSVHFGGESLLRINENPSRIDWTLKISFATISRAGTILFVGDRRTDFLELSIENRILRAEFGLGGQTKLVELSDEKENRINDGHWHTATITYFERTLTLWLDDCDPFVSRLAAGSPNCATQATIELPAKCLDPSIQCHRFFDSQSGLSLGGRPNKSRQVENGFNGCLSNFTLDSTLIDFSNLQDFEKIGKVDEGCGPKRDFCRESSCGHGAHCVNRWMGHNCRCANGYNHQIGDCHGEKSRLRQITLGEEESFQTWKVPSMASIPFSVSLEFRTIRDDTQIFAIEFDDKNLFYILALEDGLLKSMIGYSAQNIPCPDAARGHWTKIEVEFKADEVTTIVDGIYSMTQSLRLGTRGNQEMTSFYSGIAPSSSHPSRFEGCLKEIQLNGVHLKTKQSGKVRQGCVSTKGCQAGSCPENSVCRPLWEGHKCECETGFAGASCDPICSLKGVCSGGICQQTNTTKGYECHCTTGYGTPNCDHLAPLRVCPRGWWGRFGECRRCDCSQYMGFIDQCHPLTGQCLCPKAFWELGGRCIGCECGLGATSEECDAKGQCPCAGEAMGRRCDRCESDTQVLDPKSLRCLSLRGRCPSNKDGGIQWPTTLSGGEAKQSCANNETGLATRKCGENAKWQTVESWNCTTKEFSTIITKVSSLSPQDIVSAVYNASRDETVLKGRSLEIGRLVLEKVLEGEIAEHAATHIHDHDFTRKLIDSVAQILPRESPAQSVLLGARLAELGKALLHLHQNRPYLQPFAVQSENISCLFDKPGLYTILMKVDNGVLIRLTMATSPVAPLSAVSALLVLSLALLSFYACATCLIISRDKHFEVVVVKFALRKALCQHFLLTALTIVYTIGALILPSTSWLSIALSEVITSILLLLTSLYILIWSCAFGRSESQSDRVETLWVRGDPPKSGVIDHECTSPLLYPDEDHGSGPGGSVGWVSGSSDRVPSDPVVMPRPMGGLSLRENPLVPSILSPANKILRTGETVEYANPRSLSRFAKYEDEMDDAYYTYQRRKQLGTTFYR